MTNLVSFSKLKEIGIFWDTEKNQLYRANNRSVICSLQQIAGQQVINYKPVERNLEAFAANRIPKNHLKASKTTKEGRWETLVSPTRPPWSDGSSQARGKLSG